MRQEIQTIFYTVKEMCTVWSSRQCHAHLLHACSTMLCACFSDMHIMVDLWHKSCCMQISSEAVLFSISNMLMGYKHDPIQIILGCFLTFFLSSSSSPRSKPSLLTSTKAFPSNFSREVMVGSSIASVRYSTLTRRTSVMIFYSLASAKLFTDQD